MANKKRKEQDEKLLEYLLKGYERPALSREQKKELVSKLESGLSGRSSGTSDFSPPIRRLLPGLAAAAAVLVIALGVFLFYRSLSAAAPESYLVTAPIRSEIEVQTESGSLTLSPGTELLVTKGDVETFLLEEGDIYLEHEDSGFFLQTSFGVFSPVGTVISCSASANAVSLYCLEGRMKIEPAEGEVTFLEEGFMLSAEFSAAGWHSDIMRIDASAPIFMPERLSSPAEEISADESKPEDFDLHWRNSDIGFSDVSSASIDGNRLHLISGDRVFSLDLKTGILLGQTNITESYKFMKPHRSILIGYTGKAFEALDIDTGELLWRADNVPVAFAGFTLADDRLYQTSVDGSLNVYEISDGSLMFKFEHSAGLYGIPAVSSKLIVFSALDKSLRALSGDGELIWQFETNERLLGDTPVFSSDLKGMLDYNENGRIFMLDASDGTLVSEAGYEPPMVAPPLAAGEFFVFQDSSGIHVLNSSTLNREWSTSGRLYTAGLTESGEILLATDSGIQKKSMNADVGEDENWSGSFLLSGSDFIVLTEGGIERRRYR